MIAVRYINPPQWSIPTFGDGLGRVFFDTGSEFDADLTKALDRINEVQRISQEAALANSLPDTPKNRALLDQFSGDVIDRRKTPIDIEVTYNGDRLPLTGAIVSGYTTDDGGSYEFEMFADDWVDKLEAKPLNEVDAGSYVYSLANVLSSWSGPRREMVKPVLAHYGGYLTPGDVTRRDLRLWLNLGMLMEAAFCSVGWSFSCEHYETGDGANLYGYLSPESWFSYSNKNDLYYVHLELPEQQLSGADFDAPVYNELHDPFDLFNNPTPRGVDNYLLGTSQPGEEMSVRVDIVDLNITIPAAPTGQAANVLTVFVLAGNEDVIFEENFVGTTSGERVVNLNLSAVDIDGIQGKQYYVGYLMFGENGPVPFTINSGEVFFRPDPPYYADDSEIVLADLIDPEVTALDLFNSLAHFINGKVETDVASRTVTLRPPYDYTAAESGNIVPGFYMNNGPAVDFRSRTVPDSTSWEASDVDRDRYRLFKFADPDDEIVKIDDGDRRNRRVDLGSGKVSTTDIENELFSSTYDRVVDGSLIGGNGARLPHLWDNDEGVPSTDVGFRVGVWYGDIVQDRGVIQSTFLFEGVLRNTIPFLSQVATGLPAGLSLIPLTFKGYDRDLYQLFYRRETEVDDDGIVYELNLTGGVDTYEQITFRRPLLVRGETSDLQVRPIAVKGYRWGSRDPLVVAAKILKC